MSSMLSDNQWNRASTISLSLSGSEVRTVFGRDNLWKLARCKPAFLRGKIKLAEPRIYTVCAIVTHFLLSVYFYFNHRSIWTTKNYIYSIIIMKQIKYKIFLFNCTKFYDQLSISELSFLETKLWLCIKKNIILFVQLSFFIFYYTSVEYYANWSESIVFFL